MPFAMAQSSTLKHGYVALSCLGFALACGGSRPPIEQPPEPTPVDIAPAPPEHAAAPAHAAAPTNPELTAPKPATPVAAAPPPPTPVWRVTEGISTPESVLYDAAADRYLVSNINGKPVDVDNNGYITEISGDGKVTKPKLVEGGAKAKLDAPKGMGLAGNVLYVSDLTVVRKFDAKTGAPKGDIPVKDAVFLNDIAIAPDGRVFVSDTGVKLGATGLEPSGGDAVYVIDKGGKVKPVAKMKELNGPNGLLFVGKDLWVNTFASDEVYRLDDKGAKADVTHLPTGGLDGMVAMGESLLVTSWKGSAIYKGKPNAKFEPVLSSLGGAADIGFDTKRSRVVVPRFVDSAVEAYDLK
jgi:sugar lactone lactonase YvrE